MKTLTEISGIQLKEAYAWREDLIHSSRGMKKPHPGAPALAFPEPKPAVPPAEEPGLTVEASEAVPPTPANEAETVPESPAEEPAQAVEASEPVAPAPVNEAEAGPVSPAVESEVPAEPEIASPAAEEARPSAPPPPEVKAETPPAGDGRRVKSPEERYEEFLKRKAEQEDRRHRQWLDTLEAVREPLTARMKEKFKWSDERIAFALKALDMIDPQRMADLRRVVIWKLEKPDDVRPRGGRQVDEHVYVADYLFRPEPPRREERNRGDRKGRRGGGRKPRRGDNREKQGGWQQPKVGAAADGKREWRPPRKPGGGPGGPEAREGQPRGGRPPRRFPPSGPRPASGGRRDTRPSGPRPPRPPVPKPSS